MIVLGVDGMDPGFLERHWDALPNLAALRRQGGFRRLATTIPPQSPVAWSTFITGLDPAGHGIFDFIHRRPATLQPFSSMAETDEPVHHLSIGPYRLPLSSGRVRLLRRGEAFWQALDAHGIPTTIVRIPVNFPATPGKTIALSGMGTPDMQGGFGTFTFFTDDPLELSHEVSAGRVVTVRLTNGRVELGVPGPYNTLRKDRAVTSVIMIADVDPKAPAARFRIGDTVIVLNEREWSGWIHAAFPLIPGVQSAHGIFRIYAKQFHPSFQVYISPVNLDPASPDLPISNPPSYSRELARAIGPFYTQGIPEDTAVYRAGYLDLEEYLAQTRLVSDGELALLRHSLDNFKAGLLFFYFSTVDQNSHMLWGKYEDRLLETYRTVDRAIGSVIGRAGDVAILVMSDHGFDRFDRAFNLNTWLRAEGFLRLEDPAATSIGEGFAGLDWSRTQAYALGLNGLYINLRGREKNGIVADGGQRDELLRRITARLLALRDPRDGAPVVDAVYDPRQVFRGRGLEYAPDLIAGYASGYRASWETALGAAPADLLVDNRDAWIGDHCIDPRRVPGALLSNRAIRVPDPALADLAVTILNEFGISPGASMHGRPVL